MVSKGSRRGQWKATATGKMPLSVIYQRQSLDRDHIMGLISGHMRGLIRIQNVCSVKDVRPWDFFYGIIILDPVRTRHFSHFQRMWPHRSSRSSPFQECWAACCSDIRQTFHQTRNQMNNWRWDNPRAFRDQLDCINPQTTSSGKVKSTSERFSW